MQHISVTRLPAQNYVFYILSFLNTCLLNAIGCTNSYDIAPFHTDALEWWT